MKIFELYFNPKKKQNSIFDTFAYEPENQEEKQLGSLCMAGELTGALPQNNNFLDSLSFIIKNGFYGKADFSESLKDGNAFLDKEAKSGNVNWLGNLNFAILNIRDSILSFTKVGNIKILLLRDGEILDISQNLELQDQEPYPMKVFSNIASGKLLSQDKIFIATEEIFSAVSQNEEFLNQLGQVAKEKELKNIFKMQKDILLEISGICLLIMQGDISKSISLPNIKLMPIRVAKKFILIAFLFLILAPAYFLFKGEKEEVLNGGQEKIEEARAKIMMAENFIIMKKDEKALALFQEAWDILQSLNTKESASLKESIKEYIIK